MKHVCCRCGSVLHWWNLKNTFQCPACSQALRANVVAAWVVTFALWTVGEATMYVLMPKEGFTNLLLRTMLGLLAGATAGWIAFGSLSRVEIAPEAVER